MAPPKPLSAAASCLSTVLLVSALLAGTADAPAATPETPPGKVAAAVDRWATIAAAARRPGPTVAPAIPAALTDDGLDLGAAPVAVPLELLLPSLGAKAPVLGVGITPKKVMDAPMGPASDPVWQKAFWYRGSGVPGALSTALIGGHTNDSRGRPAVFAHLDRLRPGDPIVVRDTRTGLDVRFSVTESKTYPLAQTSDPVVLSRIYGAGPVMGTGPQPSPDGLSHLTLITCTGTFRNGTHDQRLVVYATRT